MPRRRKTASSIDGYKQVKSEALIKKDIMTDLKKWPLLGTYIRNNTVKTKLANGAYINNGEVGSADIIGCHFTGKFIAIEVKKVGGKQSDEQILWQRKVESFGGIYILTTSSADAIEKLLTIK